MDRTGIRLALASAVTSLTPGGNVHDFAEYNSGFLAVAAEQASIELDFDYGRPINVRGFLLARAWIVSLIDSRSYSGSGDSVFDQTAELESLEVQDDAGQWTTSHALTTESGGAYPFQVPEPSRQASVAAALVALAGVACQASPSRTS